MFDVNYNLTVHSEKTETSTYEWRKNGFLYKKCISAIQIISDTLGGGVMIQ